MNINYYGMNINYQNTNYQYVRGSLGIAQITFLF